MQTNEEPRKSNSPEDFFTVAEIERVPLKKRLEILFISTIIPSRRQLAFKYGFDEQLVHNVLSHRAYILQNWKYNTNTERLLSKLELENEMAFMELLIEWKRRVQLSGLQMTQAALLRKTSALQKILKPHERNVTADWWQLFNDNWAHKQFHDSENDSLEFEDILNDLQWMFTENAFNRLTARLRRARKGDRTRIKREILKEDTIDGVHEEEDSNELFDVSEIKAEPLYYNDDDFECEDYEFVMDEELVFDSLRRELADAEEAKYRRFIGTDHEEEHLLEADDKKSEENEEYITGFEVTKSESIDDAATDEETETETKTSIVFEQMQGNVRDTSHSLWPMVPVPVRLEIVNQAAASAVTTQSIEIPKPRPFRRRPRRDACVLTVRKDCVRLPSSVSNTFCAEDMEEETSARTEKGEESKTAQASTAKATPQPLNPPKTGTQKIIATSSTASSISHYDRVNVPETILMQFPQKEGRNNFRNSRPHITTATTPVPIRKISHGAQGQVTFKNLSLIGNEQITIAIETPMTPPLPLHDESAAVQSVIETRPITPPAVALSQLKSEQENLPRIHFIEMSTSSAAKRSREFTNRNVQSLSLQTDSTEQINFRVVNNPNEEVEVILGVHADLEQESVALDQPPESLESTVVNHSLEPQTNQQTAICERRKQKFENKLKTTSVQILEETTLTFEESTAAPNDDSDGEMSPVQLEKQTRNSSEKEVSQKKSSTKTSMKRLKRRADDSDLTLRRDKVRIW